jgi:hypothetical protein
MSRWDITESHQNLKKTVMFFITMKKVKRKTIKTCHSPDDEKKYKSSDTNAHQKNINSK